MKDIKPKRVAKLKTLTHVVRCNNCHHDFDPLKAPQSVSGAVQCPICGHYLRNEEYQNH